MAGSSNSRQHCSLLASLILEQPHSLSSSKARRCQVRLLAARDVKLEQALKDTVDWAANKRLETSKFKFKFKFPRARNLEIIGLVLGCIEAKVCK